MIRIAIVDDERIFAKKLQKSVDHLFQEQRFEFQSFIYTDGSLFSSVHTVHEFQLIFLDIDMPTVSGMEIASNLRAAGSEAILIFVSNHSNFVFETFQFAPFRFIRKEKLEEELPEAITAFCSLLQKNKSFIQLSLANRKTVVEHVHEIPYVFSIRHDLYYVTSSRETKMLSSRIYTMEKIQEMLQPYGFLRTHKTYLVNYRWVYQIQDDQIVLLPSALEETYEELPLSHRRLSEIRRQYHILLRGENEI